MKHSDEMERESPARRRPVPRPVWLTLGFVLSASIVVAIAPRIFVEPRRVDHVSLVNQTVYAVEVEVTNGQRSGWLRLGTAERGATTVVTDVIDQGDEWIFRFESQGLDGGELRMTKQELIRSEWQVVISESIGDELERKGAQPTPLRDNP